MKLGSSVPFGRGIEKVSSGIYEQQQQFIRREVEARNPTQARWSLFLVLKVALSRKMGRKMHIIHWSQGKTYIIPLVVELHTFITVVLLRHSVGEPMRLMIRGPVRTLLLFISVTSVAGVLTLMELTIYRIWVL